MSADLQTRCEHLIGELNLANPAAIVSVRPLTGGVASDIAAVEVADQTFCIKFALPKLKVAADWQAPVHRNRAEFEWLKIAAEIAPESAVKVFGRSETSHGFAMEFLSGNDVHLWKTELLNGRRSAAQPAAVASLLGKIHKASSQPGFDARPFQNQDDFHALRLEPYLVYTADRHAHVAPQLNRLAKDLYETNAVLVHGDVSPKNILFKGSQPVILDAECATMGAPEFDLAFCLNHLILKAQHVAALRPHLAADTGAFWQTYQPYVTWEEPQVLEARIAMLLPALMLARIDGKSPVEYLSKTSRKTIRTAAIELLAEPKATISEVVEALHFTWKGNDL